jgi:hypothetical protein
MTKYYFAYGSNTNKAQMKSRCPKAIAMGGMELPQAQLVFNGVADVVFHKTKTAVGGLWKITDECEGSLDRCEGIVNSEGKPFKSGGAYRKEYIKVIVTVDGREEIADALIYVMNRSWRRMPTVAYLNTIKQGFVDFGLDQTFINRALLDTRKEAAEQQIKEDAERKARWEREDYERQNSRGFHTLASWEEAKRQKRRQQSPHHGVTDLFDDDVNDLYRDFDQRESYPEHSDRFDADDLRDIREVPPRQTKTVQKAHDKSAKGSNIPSGRSAKSPHLFAPTPVWARKKA